MRLLGKPGLGQHFEDGFRLVKFSDMNTLVVCSKRFKNPQNHLLATTMRCTRMTIRVDALSLVFGGNDK